MDMVIFCNRECCRLRVSTGEIIAGSEVYPGPSVHSEEILTAIKDMIAQEWHPSPIFEMGSLDDDVEILD